MPIEKEVAKRAQELADVMHARRQSHVEKRADLLSQLIAVDAELARADDADQRLDAFRPKAGDDAICPYCWMYDRIERPLHAVERNPDDLETKAGADFFRCDVCDNRYASESTD